MALFENFPYTDLHQLNLDWLIDQLNKISESAVLSVNGQTGVVTLYQNAQMVLPDVPEDNWTIIRMCDGTHRGILFGNDNKAYIVHGNLMAELYANNNPPPYPVTRVNGLTGDVELYTDQYVRLPDLTDAQMTNWTFFRILNNQSHGIQFEDDGSAYIINGQQRYQIYTAADTPPYPVSSVNGQTGTVVLFTDTNGNVAMPAFTDPNYDGWSINRTVNGTNVGLEFKEDGSLILKVGANTYTVYTALEPAANYVTNATDSVQTITEDSDDDYWGLVRETSEGRVGILFSNTDPDAPEAYIAYVDSNNQDQTVQLLTTADLPATGVYSVNTKTGIVTLYGSDLEMNLSDSRNIDDAVEDTNECIAIYEPSNTATHNISIGQIVIWNYATYIATNNISIGDTLSLSNLSSITDGLVNYILNKFKPVAVAGVTAASDVTIDSNDSYVIDKLVVINCRITLAASKATGSGLMFHFPQANTSRPDGSSFGSVSTNTYDHSGTIANYSGEVMVMPADTWPAGTYDVSGCYISV